GPAPGTGETAPRADPGADLPWSPRKGKVIGGGPANEHNYTTGLMLHYFLTGSAASRAAVLELAPWVIDVDAGRETGVRWLGGRGVTGGRPVPREARPPTAPAAAVATRSTHCSMPTA